MIGSHLRAALRGALRGLISNRSHALLNVAGLAIAFATAILIGLFVRDELGYDRMIPSYRQVYRVDSELQMPAAKSMHFDSSDYGIARRLELEFPSVQAATRLAPNGSNGQMAVRHGAVEADEAVYWGDPNFFSVLPFKAIAGDPTSALQDPNGIVITRRLARKYFGRDAPLGARLDLDRQHTMRVDAVLEDLPSNTSFDFDAVASGRAAFSTLTQLDARPRGFHFTPDVYTYLRLRPGASVTPLRQAMYRFSERALGIPHHLGTGIDASLSLTALADIHLHPAGISAMKPSGDIQTVRAFSVIAVLVLLLGTINFVSLMTAGASRRAVEVAMRKAVGASRRDLMLQFVSEVVLYSAAAMLLAIAIVESVLPELNGFLGRHLLFQYWREPEEMSVLAAAVVLVGVCASAYPALILSAYRPAQVLRGILGDVARPALVRQLLVGLQFAILIGLAVAAAVIYRQAEYALGARVRFPGEQVLLITAPCHSRFYDALQSIPGVRATTCSLSAPTNTAHAPSNEAEPVRLADGSTRMLFYSSVDFGFFDFYGLRPLAGRLLSSARSTDAGVMPRASAPPRALSVVINRSAAYQLGFASPGRAIGQSVRGELSCTRFDVIGVVPDLPTDSVREAIRPTAYYVDPGLLPLISSRIDAERLPQVMPAIAAAWNSFGAPRPLQEQFLDRYVQSLCIDIVREARLLTGFAVVALVVACLGLLSLAAYTVEQRTREIGIRKALGASTRDILRLLLWQFSRPALAANLLAWPVVAYLMSRWLRGFYYHVTLSWWLFAAAGVAVLAVTLATVTAHSWLVARARPVLALRYE